MSSLREIALSALEAHRFALMMRDEDLVMDDLCGACTAASAYLHQRLREKGIDSRLVFAHGHVFVRVGETIIDVTGEQFGHDPIYIGPRLDGYEYEAIEEYAELQVALDRMCEMWPWDAEQIEQRVLNGRRVA